MRNMVEARIAERGRALIWMLPQVDTVFKGAWIPAGDIDQKVVSTYAGRQPVHRRHQMKRSEEPRWYYLHRDNTRISLVTVSMPLDKENSDKENPWNDGAFFVVGTRDIIGEFVGNREFIGKKGLQLKMQPLAWMQGKAHQMFHSGKELLNAISEQRLDLREAQHIQEKIKRIYEWEK